MGIHFISIVAVTFALVSLGSSAGRTTSVQETCRGGQILDRTTIHSGGLNITHITQSCPGLAKKARSIPNDTVERRQSNIVNVCTPTCDFFCGVTGPDPLLADCQTLSTQLEFLPAGFVTPPESATIFTWQSCSAAFVNTGLSTTLEFCFGIMGILVSDISSVCVNVAGFCIPPTVTASTIWDVEVLLDTSNSTA